jgi:hypothetical protein
VFTRALGPYPEVDESNPNTLYLPKMELNITVSSMTMSPQWYPSFRLSGSVVCIPHLFHTSLKLSGVGIGYVTESVLKCVVKEYLL